MVENEENIEYARRSSMSYGTRYGVSVLISLGVFFAIRIIAGIGPLASNIFLDIPAVILCAIIFIVVSGLITVEESYMKAITRFGKKKEEGGELEPGLKWILLPGIIDRVKAVDFIREMGILLFGKGIAKIDFQDGSATPVRVTLFLRTKNPRTPYYSSEEMKKIKKAIGDDNIGEDEAAKNLGITKRSGFHRSVFDIDDVYQSVVDQGENLTRPHLNSLKIDEALVQGKAGFNILEIIRERSKEKKDPENKVDELVKWIDNYGKEVLRVTIADFILPPELEKARQRKHESEKLKEAADNVAEKEAIESVGAIAKAVEMIKEGIGKDNKELGKKIVDAAQHIMFTKWGIDSKTRLEIAGQGGDGKIDKDKLNYATIVATSLKTQQMIEGMKEDTKKKNTKKKKDKE